MPVYEYECAKCAHITEVSFKLSEDSSQAACEKCGNFAKKVMSLNSFHLKGRGWHKDGYAGKYDAFDDAMKCDF